MPIRTLSHVCSNNLFLPWHRMLVSSFEQRIQAIQPNVTIPYWVRQCSL